MPLVACFGETLWDLFPTYKSIGGAPFNVAFRLNSLGMETYLISRVGNDVKGDDIVNYLEQQGMCVSSIQRDEELATGEVIVQLDESKSARYTIKKPVAWDSIETSSEIITKVNKSDALIFGSLACRDEKSKKTLHSLLSHSKLKVFDVNLRPPFYSRKLIIELLLLADFIKINEEELVEISKYFGIYSSSIMESMKILSDVTQSKHVCVTMGKNGACLLTDEQYYQNSGYNVKVVDTVGAGDSFLASLIYHKLLDVNPQKYLDISCAIGSLVVSKHGANPKITQREIINLMD